MIYITGDTHGEQQRFTRREYSIEGNLGRKDTLIVCGDFGFLFEGTDKEQRFLDYLAQKPFRTLFVDGNHENFNLLMSYPVEKWCGGNVHIIKRDPDKKEAKVIHLMRGQVFEIENKKIFTFGGAYSIDKSFRVPNRSCWEQELPTEKERKEAVEQLKEHRYKVDYIITHAAPEETMSIFHPKHTEEKKLNNFLEWIRENVEYRHWYFGHLHRDEDLWRSQTVLWYQVKNMETNENID